ncbi:MAG TPA: hypothetical protein DD649_07130 [Providencia sp.]|uniref:glycosyltransferase family 2 protein n=1 Tax=Providencia sp. TaxID=589 RepID=UPI000E9C6533|nr:glycosyltransferase family 2 protein [Providencia sp.]MBP6082481.1 glycosyltransferase family 2 protein [Providencia sp.]HBO22645.1 hypothetical protein [Providencia sp.]
MTVNKPYKLTIIIAAYNVEDFIKPCIMSFIKQSRAWSQLIIVNDGSTDNTLNIISNIITNQKNIFLVQKENGGLSSARNAGIDFSINNTDFISFLDGDDLLSPDYLESFLAYYDKNTDIIEFNIQRFSCDRKKISLIRICNSFENNEMNYKTFEIVLKKYNWHACGRFFNSNLLSMNRFTINRRYEDFILVPHLYLLAKKIKAIPSPLYLYRTNPNSITKNAKPSDIDDIIYGFNKLKEKLNTSQVYILKKRTSTHITKVIINIPQSNRDVAFIKKANFLKKSKLRIKLHFYSYLFLFNTKQIFKKIHSLRLR